MSRGADAVSPLQRRRLASPVLIPLLILVGTGLFAIDFGPH